MFKFEKHKIAVMTSLAMGLTVLNAEGSTLSDQAKTLPKSDMHALLLKELAELNKRTAELNKIVARLEAEEHTTKKPKIQQGVRYASLNKSSKILSDARVDPTRKARKVTHKAYQVKKNPSVVNLNKDNVQYQDAQYKNVPFYLQPHLIDVDEKDGSNYYLYLDKNYYDISPGELNQTQYFQIINQNSPESTANNNLCIKNALCFSALTNIDLRYYNHRGGLEGGIGNQTNSLVGLGIRPMFGPDYGSVYGSINNANLFVDGYVNPYVSAHMNLAYVNGSVKLKSYQYNAADWSSVYADAAAVKMDEVFGTLIVPNTPFFARIGKQYLNFGDYKPYPITESLVQLMTQMRSGAIIGGFVLPNGVYASANYSMSRASLEDVSNPLQGSPLADQGRARNFGGKVGYESKINALQFDVNASYIYDMRDSDYLSENSWFYSTQVPYIFEAFYKHLADNQVTLMTRSPGVALHADAHWNRFGMLAEYATALNRMNPSFDNSKISAWGLHGNMMFDFFSYSSLVDLGYERGYNANVFQTIVYGPLPIIPGVPLPIQLGNALPQSRLVGTLSVNVMPGVVLSGQWVHDKDFPESLQGTGRTSDIGIVRVSAQL